MIIENGSLIVKIKDSAVQVPVEYFATEKTIHVFQVPNGYRENELFISYSNNNQVTEYPACAQEGILYLGSIKLPASDEKSLEQAKKNKIDEINKSCNEESKVISNNYPEAEVLSWPQQVKEAEAIKLDQNSHAPLLSSLAAARDVNLLDLATLVIAKADAFALATGKIIGKRQLLEKQITAATTLKEVEDIKW